MLILINSCRCLKQNKELHILFSWAYVQYKISKLYASRCLVTFKDKFLVLNPHTRTWNYFTGVCKILIIINCLSSWKFYKHRLNNFQITFSLSALVGEPLQTNLLPVSGEFKTHRHSPSQCLRKKLSRCLVNFMSQNFMRFLWRLYAQDF